MAEAVSKGRVKAASPRESGLMHACGKGDEVPFFPRHNSSFQTGSEKFQPQPLDSVKDPGEPVIHSPLCFC